MAKRQRKKKKTSKRYVLYEAKGTLKRKNKFCPKCGPGVFLAQHEDRLVCGKCQYSEFTSTKAESSKETPKPENKEQKSETKKQ